jgi:hypothetical protein
VFKRLRIGVLLYVLVFVAAATFLADRRARDWDHPLWVNVYMAPPAGAAPASPAEPMAAADFERLEAFFNAQGHAYGLPIERPLRFHPAGALAEPLPQLPTDTSILGAVWWSLKMRSLRIRLDWRDEPTPDIILFVILHEPRGNLPVERSAALRKGLIAVAHVIDSPGAVDSNRVVVAHELLHTLGATDKYDLRTNQPLPPHGYAEPDRRPILPQSRAELMAGRIPVTRDSAVIPEGLHDVVIGRATAAEIGWLDSGDW